MYPQTPGGFTARREETTDPRCTQVPQSCSYALRCMGRHSAANLSALDQIPPLDVLMVWHTYMLMPITYWIDSQQSLPTLGSLGGIPWENLVNIVVQFRGVMINCIHSAQVHQCRNSRFYSDIRSASYLGGINFSSIYPGYDSGTS